MNVQTLTKQNINQRQHERDFKIKKLNLQQTTTTTNKPPPPKQIHIVVATNY